MHGGVEEGSASDTAAAEHPTRLWLSRRCSVASDSDDLPSSPKLKQSEKGACASQSPRPLSSDGGSPTGFVRVETAVEARLTEHQAVYVASSAYSRVSCDSYMRGTHWRRWGTEQRDGTTEL